MSTAASTPGPQGRAETVRRLVSAAIELFAQRGPDGVSLRQVAAAAGVNYGLIHQYIGTKDDLLRLVFRSVSEQAAGRFSGAPDLDTALDDLVRPGAPTPYVRILTWALLQGRDGTELLGRSPALAAFVERLVDGDEESAEARVRVANAVAMTLGWQLFGDFITSAVGLEDLSADEVDTTRRRLARALVLGD